MKLCFFTDIHGNRAAFDAFCQDVERRETDLVVFGGDFIGYYYDADEIITAVREKGWHCLLGNHDKMFLDMLAGELSEEYVTGRYGSSYRHAKETISEENIAFLKTLSSSWELETDGKSIGFFHGAPEDALNARLYPDTEPSDLTLYEKYDYLFTGHTHHKMIRDIGGCHVINPGSAGQQRDGKGTSYVMFDTASGKEEICVFQYDMTELLEQIKERDGADEKMYHKLTEVLTREPKIYN